MKNLVAGALIALLLGACSSSGGNAKQPEDDFLDQVEAVCREASSKIRKLSAGADGAPSDLFDIITDVSDSFGELTPPSDLRKPWDKYTTKVDDQLSSLSAVVDAIDAGDTATELSAVADVNSKGDEADLAVNTLGAIRCRGLVPLNALTAEDLGTLVTDVTTPVTETTTPPTETTVETSPPNTPLSIDTIPVTEAPPATTVPADILPTDLSVEAVAPDGYQWIPFEPPKANGLYNNSIIGDLVVSYSAGEFESLADSSITATVYVVTLSTEFTPQYVTAYQFWEAVDKGTDVVTPGGRTVHQQIGAFENIDCAVYTGGTRGVALCTFTGTDGLPLMDQFLTANGF